MATSFFCHAKKMDRSSTGELLETKRVAVESGRHLDPLEKYKWVASARSSVSCSRASSGEAELVKVGRFDEAIADRRVSRGSTDAMSGVETSR